jgi:hypothetical protein
VDQSIHFSFLCVFTDEIYGLLKATVALADLRVFFVLGRVQIHLMSAREFMVTEYIYIYIYRR